MARKKIEEKETEKSTKKSEEKLDLTEIREDLTNYMKDVINKEVSKAVEKANKKLIRHKNSIIIKRDIFIIILIIICLFLGYNLYKSSNINIDITSKKVTEKKVSKEIKEIEEEPNTLEELTKNYGYLVDNIKISENSSYLKLYYKGELSDELKLYLSLNNLDDDKIVSEEESVYIDENDLKDKYNDIFDGEFVPKSFKYNDLNFHYLSSKSLFFADGKFEKTKSDIVREIINIEEKDNQILITTVEGLLKDSKLYNILSREQVKKYNSNDSLEKYKDLLTKMKYNFNKIDDEYKLLKVEVM